MSVNNNRTPSGSEIEATALRKTLELATLEGRKVLELATLEDAWRVYWESPSGSEIEAEAERKIKTLELATTADEARAVYNRSIRRLKRSPSKGKTV